MEQKIYKIDATGKVLGRLAASLAVILRGKQKAQFERHIDRGDKVEVANVSKIKYTENKAKQKIYYRHSGYPGGLGRQTLENKFKNNPAQVLRQAVYGMLPKNKTRAQLIKKLIMLREETK